MTTARTRLAQIACPSECLQRVETERPLMPIGGRGAARPRFVASPATPLFSIHIRHLSDRHRRSLGADRRL